MMLNGAIKARVYAASDCVKKALPGVKPMAVRGNSKDERTGEELLSRQKLSPQYVQHAQDVRRVWRVLLTDS